MPDFRNQVLLGIGRVLEPIGGEQAPTRVDFASPMPVVFDVCRMAELSSGVGRSYGIVLLAVTLTHAGVDTVRGVFDPYISMANQGITPEEFDMWLTDVFVYCTGAGTIGSTQVAIFYPTYLAVGVSLGHLIWRTTSAISFSDIAGTGDDQAGHISTIGEGKAATFPLYIPIGSILTTRGTSLAAGDELVTFKFWVGPKGVRPAGVA